MSIRFYLRRLKNKAGCYPFLLRNLKKERYTCPVCDYSGPFRDVHPPTGLRKHAKCPACGSLDHVAPEPFFRGFFSARFGTYETADLSMKGVDHRVDLQALPFADQTYDFVFASHVLEHVPDDIKAISEIRRILKPNGIAVLPVPLVAEKTIEYPEPNPSEEYHVRAPGIDYFDRYEPYFSKVERFSSDSLNEKYQLHIVEDRSHWPTKACPLRPPMQGDRHIDIVPVCHV